MKLWLAILLGVSAFGASLHDQTVAALLAREFPQAKLNYLLLDAQSRETIAARWPSPRTAVPAGSLVKPFTALAYAASHHLEYPVLVCRGRASHCWSAKPHGAVGIEEAIAQSCNAYFLALAARIGADEIAATAEQFGLAPPQKDTAPARIGLGRDWKIAPVAIARAYCELTMRSTDPGVRPILAGMAISAERGTGRGIDRGALAKTGTAPCVHARRSPGDGYAVALFPAEAPRYVLLVRVDGVPGAVAAITAGQMVRVVRYGK
jgi:hypothetical protein